MRRLSLSVFAASALLLGACDTNAPQVTDSASSASVFTCNAPSISTSNDGTYIYITQLGSQGAVAESSSNAGSNWTREGVAGDGDTDVRVEYSPWMGFGTRKTLHLRARNICYNNTTDSFVFSGYGSTTVFYNDEGI